MNNTTLLLNNKDTNETVLLEFPYWRPTLGIILFSSTSSICGIIVVYICMLVVLLSVKKDHFKPLDILHISLLCLSILEDASKIILDIIYSPSVFRNCICPAVLSLIFSVHYTFFTVYRPVCFACLGVLQFLVIKGKKRLVNRKSSFGMIAFCIGVSLIFVAITFNFYYETNERIFCFESYCPDSRSESIFGDVTKALLIVVFGSLLPSLVVVLVMSTLSCTVFKKYYTGGDDQLNRRMLSLPVVMPLTLVASTVLEGLIILSIAEVFLLLPLGEFLPFWLLFTQSVVLVLSRVITRLIYPLVLVYTHSYIRETVKNLPKRFKTPIQVVPFTVGSGLSTTL